MSQDLTSAPATPETDQLKREIAKLTKINSALIQRVEMSTDSHASAYSLFQTALALEGQVRGRTEDLKNVLFRLERTNDELSAARDASERANRFKTRFFTAVGHDLLQPLHAARLSVSALHDPQATPYQRRLADAIGHALSTIEDLLKSILDISKLEAGAITPTLQPVSLEELFVSLAVDMEPFAQAKKLDLTCQSNLLSVTSDPLMLRRILQNLLANAVQYTQRGEIKLLATRRGSNVVIEVSDTGPGIPPAERKMIFEEFQRGPLTDQPDIGGFGLGLSIVQRMADALGHPLDLASEVGRGTRFSITAPFTAAVDRRIKPPVVPSVTRAFGLEGAKVLVIDNDAAVLEAMQALLERWSCEAYTVRSLAQLDAVIASELRPDIVLADYHLDHGESGLGAVERLRSLTNPELPVVIVTADHSSDIALKAQKSRCELLLKPVKPAELRALMAHLLA